MIRFCLLGLLFIAKCNFSQELNVVNCLKGEKEDGLRTLDKISSSNYLLNIRSNSNTQDFIRNDSVNNYSNDWLFKLNENGDTIWKRMLPNTDKALNETVLPSFITPNFFTFSNFNYINKIYSFKNNEIILHYPFVDSITSIDSIFVYNDYISTNHEYYLNFGVLKLDGNYKVFPFTIDTFPINGEPFGDGDIITNVVNDSIYQLACGFSRPYGWHIYSININTKVVTKNFIEQTTDDLVTARYYNVINASNHLFLLSRGYIDTSVSILKLDQNGEIENEVQLPVGTSTIDALSNGNILLTGNNYIYPTGQHFQGFYVILSINNLSLTKYNLQNNYLDSIFNSVSISNSLHDELSGGIKEKIDNYSYFLIREDYGSSYPYLTDNKLVKINPETGVQIWEKSIDSVSYFTNDINGDNILINYYNVDGGFIVRNRISNIDSNGIEKWKINLPDTLTYNGKLIFSNSEIKYYRSLNYKNQFIVSSYYIDTADNNAVDVIYFFVSNIDGTVKVAEFSGVSGIVDFYNSANNNLSVITLETNKCEAASNLDVVIYKYNEVLNAIKSNKYIAKDDFVLFPNPTYNTINIQFNQSQITENAVLKIMDNSGRIIYSSILKNEPQHTIDVHQLPDGMYFLQIDDAKELHQIKKFQVIH